MPRIAIIQFPGSNCESESIRAVRAAGMDAEEFLWNRDKSDLASFDGYFIVGGFSYQDRSRAGIIASLDPIMQYLRNENEKDKPILGVCNGAQILVESGFVPGLAEYKQAMALATNKRVKEGSVLGTGFYNAWVHMKLSAQRSSSAFTNTLPDNFTMRIPVAHGEGRFVIPDPLLSEMKENQLTTFQYCDENGNVSGEFPINPNGSAYNLAGVSNAKGNVLALMPHPERVAEGKPLFESMREYITSRGVVKVTHNLQYTPPAPEIKAYARNPKNLEFIVESIITDNEAFTVQNTLSNIGIPIAIKRYTHWEISSANPTKILADQILSTGEILNPNKERLLTGAVVQDSWQCLLVRYHDDVAGMRMKQTLIHQHGLSGIESVHSGVLWVITRLDGAGNDFSQKILNTHILFNQYSQDCFRYS